MIAISDLKNLVKIIRAEIITQSGIDGDHVLHGQSSYGANIQKNNTTTNTILETFTPSDSFVVFNVDNSVSGDDLVEEGKLDVCVYSSFKAHIMFYGTNCGINAIRTRARFLTQELLTKFESQGIHIQSIDNEEQVNDFLNGKLVSRQDIIVHFSCKIDTSLITKYESYEEVNLPDDAIAF